MNANTWRNNIEGKRQGLLAVQTEGFNVGGPVFIPGKINKNTEKLFFFVGVEWQSQLVPNGVHNVTVPTALERQGDFSQTHDGGSFTPTSRFWIRPTTSRHFPGT